MLKAMRGGQRWLTGLFIVALGGVFVFFLVPGMGRQSGPSAGSLIEVGSYRFGISQFEAERARRVEQYEQALGDQFDAAALADQLNDITAQVLVERAILADEATELGMGMFMAVGKGSANAPRFIALRNKPGLAAHAGDEEEDEDAPERHDEEGGQPALAAPHCLEHACSSP